MSSVREGRKIWERCPAESTRKWRRVLSFLSSHAGRSAKSFNYSVSSVPEKECGYPYFWQVEANITRFLCSYHSVRLAPSHIRLTPVLCPSHIRISASLPPRLGTLSGPRASPRLHLIPSFRVRPVRASFHLCSSDI